MSDGRRSFVGPGLFVGLWITTLGVIFLLDQQGIVPAHVSFAFVWPGILIALGLGGIFSSHSAGKFWGVILLTLGSISLSNELGLLHIRIASLWPLFLIGLGLWMLFNSSGRFGPPFNKWDRWQGRFGPWPTYGQDSGSASPQPPPPPPPSSGANVAGFAVSAGGGPSGNYGADPTFDQAAIFSGFKRRITSQHFTYGKVSVVLGGFNLDFTHADIEGDRAVLQIDAVFGGGEVRIPETWDVVIEAGAIAGAFVDETYGRPNGAPPNTKKLVIRGAAVFGGVTIKN